jgi:hypothetical protein
MHPRIGKRSKYNQTEKKPESKAVEFIVLNTKKSITLKQEYLYLEDVKTALNIHHLEQNIVLKRWLVGQIQTGQPTDKLVGLLEKSFEQDRHRLQKMYKISI